MLWCICIHMLTIVSHSVLMGYKNTFCCNYTLLYYYSYYFRHQCMLVAGLSKQTMALQDDELDFAHIRIQSRRHSYIYIMAPVRY